MYNVSNDFQLFDQYVLSEKNESNEFVMPDEDTVVSIDKDGQPVSYFQDNIWDFNAFFNLTRNQKSDYQLNFHSDKHQPELLLELKQRIYFLIWGVEGQLLHMSENTFRKFSQCRNIVRASQCLRVFKDTSVNSFVLLSNELIFSQLLHEQKKNSEKTVTLALQALSVLKQLNSNFPENRHFSLGIPEGKSISQIAKQYSSTGKGHYPTVIPVIYEQLMGRLIDDVESAYSKRPEFRDAKKYAKKYNMTERDAVQEFRKIEGACYMTLSAFTGMRSSELTQINSGSYKEIDLDGVVLCSLRSSTSKLEKIPKEDTWACAPICEKALTILMELNDDYRAQKNDIHESPRFSFDGSRGSGQNICMQRKSVILNTSGLLKLFNSYSKYLDITYISEEMDEINRLLNPSIPNQYNPVKEREDGSFYWHFTTHSLRRSIAHFLVGNGLVTLAALKHQFKHISLSMTAIYASHAEVLTLLGIENPASVKKAVEDAEMESHKIYLRDVLDHPEEQSGGFIKAFEGDPKILTDEQFEKLAKETNGANKSTGYGRCFAGFQCKMTHLFEASTCIGRDCENLNINHDEALRWQERHKHIAVKIQQMKEMGFYNQNTLARELTDIRSAEKVMSDHNIAFERFELGGM